ncbi:MAG TPA: cytochrome c [Xanthobacteraceae bacterium]|nr:cytochrome c [Xanthobacteraceae bacterium]
MTRSVQRLVEAFPAIGLVVLIALGACGPASSEDPPAGDAANGKRLYVTVGCFECHGRVGQGGAYTGPAPVLAKTALPAEAFVAFIREPPNDMPAYAASVLPDKAAADIYAYLQALDGPRPVKDIPILND